MTKRMAVLQTNNMRMIEGLKDSDFPLHFRQHIELLDSLLAQDLDRHFDSGDDMDRN